jgi:acid phosphatase family membrane protein YuiD
MVEFNFFYENLLLIPAITFVVTVLLKWIFVKLNTWKIDVSRALWSWWMPSVHSSVVVSLATAVAIKHWVHSDLFAIAMTFTVIIIYDAINVRFEAWQHAAAINESIWEKKFKESLWHLPSEAFAWSVLGMIIAVIIYFI